jgi:hypothetical protein
MVHYEEGNFTHSYQWMISTKFQLIWPCSFRAADYLEINQSETRIARGSLIF